MFVLLQPTQETDESLSDEAIAKELQMDEDMEVGSGHVANVYMHDNVPIIIRVWSYQKMLCSVIKDMNEN